MTPRRALVTDALWLLVALGIVAAGAVGFRILGANRVPVAASPVERAVAPVEVGELVRHAGALPVTGEGFVRPVREVIVAAEVSGRIVELHPALRSRGTVAKDEVLVRLDDRAARASLERAESDIASTRARLQLNTTQLERTRTLRERGVVSEDALDQALSRQSELEGTLASLRSARESARVALDATRVVAPFDGRILSKDADVGAVVSPGQAIATLASVAELEVSVALEEDAAALVPGLFDAGTGGASATVTARFAGREYDYAARVARVVPALDAGTRTLDVTVALARPDAPLAPSAPPALINAWASVTIDGAAPAGVAPYALPADTVRQGDTVWLADDGALRIVGARVLRIEGGTSYVELDDVPPGAALVTSVLPAPVDGMPVSIADEAAVEEPAGAASDGVSLVDGASVR